jgi:competence protein ComEC
MAAAVATWLGTLLGFARSSAVGVLVAAAALLVVMRSRRVAVIVAFAAVGAVSGMLAAARIDATMTAVVRAGPVEFVGTVVEDSGPRRPAVVRPEEARDEDGWVEWRGPPLAVGPAPELPMVAGQRVRVTGTLRHAPGRIRGDPVAGRVSPGSVEVVGSAGGPFFVVGNAVRERVLSVLDLDDPAQALISGFLIGDTSGLGNSDLDALRRSGLTHFIAVSGSNVALFLAGWWALTSVFGVGAKRRLALGLVGLGIFVVATRWEASVLRAAFMASVVLGAAAAGINVDAWVAVGVAIIVLLLAAGHLAVDVGFQLSAAATIGIMVGAGMFTGRRPRILWATLGAATAAQVAVVPVLLWHFGTVPLMSPIANLLSAPFVTAATVGGTFAVVSGWGPAVAVASLPAGAVLFIANLAARWPQLGTAGVAVVAAIAALVRLPKSRPFAVAGTAAAVALVVMMPVGRPSVPEVTFLDIGQGDSVVLRDPGGTTVLVDGGRDPVVLTDALRRNHVGRIDLLVATHGDIDHVGGFDGIVDRHSIGRVWVPDQPDLGEELEGLLEDAQRLGIPIDRVRRGISYRAGEIGFEALGPVRRYLARNDGSIVLWVVAERTLLLAGDIGAIAQLELPPLHPDVLLVPHHGSGSTDPGWLASTVGEIAVVSVGPNTYGHPAPETMAVLETSDAEIRITMDEGDITIPLDRP